MVGNYQIAYEQEFTRSCGAPTVARNIWRMLQRQRSAQDHGYPAPAVYSGPEAYKELCLRDDIDLVYVCTDWAHHVPVALCAMEHGKHVAVEVPSANGNVTATASTTIPESVPIVDVMLKHERDSLYSAYVVLEKVEEAAFCRFFVRLNDTFWVPSLFGNFVYSSAEDEPDKVLLRRGYDLDMRDYVSNFISGETVEVKLCTMTEPMYKYWQDFDNNLFYGRTPFFPAKSNPASNLLGAVGYFAGYGCSTASFVVP